MDTKALTDVLVAYFRQAPVPVVCAYLFGSNARDEARPESDIDVAVLLFPERDQASRGGGRPAGLLTTVQGDLERLLHRPVDLVDMRRAPVDLIHRILRDGHLVCERDTVERVRFEVDKRNEYFDLLPFLRRYRRGQAA
jgi:predicted nucleotidyltransferase